MFELVDTFAIYGQNKGQTVLLVWKNVLKLKAKLKTHEIY